jgi:subtilisin-like proprotein convertase family protein
VSGVTGPGADVAVTLNGVTHTYSEDIDVLLVGPNGQDVALMTYAGEGPINANLTFSDSASNSVPFAGTISSGMYLPTDYGVLSFPSPAPARPYGTMLSPLAATPNGNWSLYVFDTYLDASGSISGGWNLSFVTSNSILNCCVSFPAPTLAAITVSNSTVHFSWDTMPGLN